MGSKIYKYSNLYDADGNLLRKVDEKTGVLKNYTTEELEQLLDRLSENKDENGNVKNPKALNNVYRMLMQYYMLYGNPHEEEIKQKLEEMAKQRGLEAQVEEAMKELKEAVINDQEEPKDVTEDGFTEYEEVTDEPEEITNADIA